MYVCFVAFAAFVVALPCWSTEHRRSSWFLPSGGKNTDPLQQTFVCSLFLPMPNFQCWCLCARVIVMARSCLWLLLFWSACAFQLKSRQVSLWLVKLRRRRRISKRVWILQFSSVGVSVLVDSDSLVEIQLLLSLCCTVLGFENG